MRPATLASLPSLAPADVRPAPRGARPSFLHRTLAVAQAIAEVLAEARELRRTLSRRYPFADF
jgi:hypothetical protein